MAVEHVIGKNTGKIMLYALSTCGWCQKTKKLLNDAGIDYFYIDVDSLKGDERDEIMNAIKRWNPDCSFPTIVIDDNKCVVGFREKEIKDALTLKL